MLLPDLCAGLLSYMVFCDKQDLDLYARENDGRAPEPIVGSCTLRHGPDWI